MTQPSVINLAYRGIEYFRSLIVQEIPFSFPRYGDGEFSSILGHTGINCDGVQYTPALRDALTETLMYPHLQDNYYYGLLAIAFRFYRLDIEKFTTMHNLDITWTEATFLVAANRQGKFGNFLSILQQRPILYVGPRHLQGLPEILRLQIPHFVEVSEKNAFEAREEIRNKVLVYADMSNFIGFSAGPVTKWLIWSIYPDLGDTHTLFDFGSIFDAYVDRPSRRYQRRDTWTETAQANLE